MANDQLIVTARRLGNDLRQLKRELRCRYKKPTQQVTSQKVQKTASVLAEIWLTNLSRLAPVTKSVSSKYLANLNVSFQRLLLCTEKATLRRLYDAQIKAILKDYTAQLIIPLMQSAEEPQPLDNLQPQEREAFEPTAFVGHSFSVDDIPVADVFIRVFEAIGITVATGEKPRVGGISEKVKRRIEKQYIFIGVFTRKHKIAEKESWTTSEWVIDEKAYAVGRNKKLVLLVEEGVDSIGGIQGDAEYIKFARHELQKAILSILQLFSLSARDLDE